MRILKCYLILLVACLCPVSKGNGGATNCLAFYLIADTVPWEALEDGTVKPDGLKLFPFPILADADFTSYDWSNHIFTISAPATKRLARGLSLGGESIVYTSDKDAYNFVNQAPPRLFVLVASGTPIYVGFFASPAMSYVNTLPAVYADAEILLFPVDATNDAKFEIEMYSVPRVTANGTNWCSDPRSDKRILASLQKLFPDASGPIMTNFPAGQSKH
jgi:hypothetical protein